MHKQITIDDFLGQLKAQGVPRDHLAFKCPICGTVQSIASLIRAGAGKTAADVERSIGFSCIGRFTKAGPHRNGEPAGRGCDWTLGGLLQLHEIEVLTADGKLVPHFAPASVDEAKLLHKTFSA